MKNQDLDTLRYQGFIPGPLEEEVSFNERVSYCLHLKNDFEFTTPPPEILEEALPITERLFGIAPSWIPLNFSNQQLPPWVGGCAWIFQKTKSSPTGAFIQLRKSLKDSPSLLLYDRKELLAHELSHVGRMAFDEPKYEEIFAYMTSPHTFRRFIGPVFSQNWEMMIFMTFVIFVFLADLCSLWWGGWDSYVALFPLKILPFAWLGWLLCKLTLKQLKIKRLKKRFPVKLLYCLTDLEIDSFDKMTDEQIQLYGTQQTCLRWKMILNNNIC